MAKHHNTDLQPATHCEDCRIRMAVQRGTTTYKVTDPETGKIVTLNKPQAIVRLRKRCRCKQLGYKK